MKLKIKVPYLLYEVKYHFKKQKNLGEIESIILSILIFNSKNNENDNLLDFVCNSLGLEDKWKDYITFIIKEQLLAFQIIEIKTPDLKLDELFVGDIKVHEKIKENFFNNQFLGFEKEERNSQHSILSPLIYIFEPQIFENENFQDSLYEDNYDSNLNKDILKRNETINGLIQDFGEKFLKSNEILYKFEITNEKDKNLVLSSSEQSIFSIKLEKNQIVNDDKNFLELFNWYKKYNMIHSFKTQIIQNFESLLKDIPETNEGEIYLKFDEYNSVIEKYKKKDPNFDFIIYNQEFTKLNRKSVNINLFDETIKLSLLVVSKYVFENFENFVKENYKESNLLELINYFNEKQKNIFKNIMLENYLDIFLENRYYQNFVINSFSEIKQINDFWFWNEMEFDTFKKIFENMNSDEIEKVLNNIQSSKEEFKNFKNVNNKLNFLYSRNFELKRFNLFENCYWIKDFESKIKEYENILNSNDLDKIKKFIDDLDKLIKNEKDELLLEIKNYYSKWINSLKEKERNLIEKDKQKIIDKILDILNNDIRGKLDEWLKKNTGVKDKDVDIFSLIEKIGDKKLKDKLHKLRDIRNEYAHKSNDSLKNKLNGMKLNELNEQLNNLIELKKVIEEEK